MNSVGYFSAFFAGVASFIAPCVLPLVPGYISYITGVSMDNLENPTAEQRKLILIRAILFSLGFTIVFTLLGATASSIGGLLQSNKRLLEQIAGVVIIIFGLMISGLVNIPFLYREKRIQLRTESAGVFAPVILGMAFAFAWTPCVGPILGGILFIASTTGTLASGISLLLVYSLGMAIPLIATAVLFSRAVTVFGFIKKHYKVIMAISGGFLVIMGLLLIFGYFSYFNIMLQRQYLKLKWTFF